MVTLALEALDAGNTPWAHTLADSYTELQDSMIALLPGAKEALEMLRGMGIRLAVVTNGASAAQREKLNRFGITHYFEKIFIDTEIGYSKPDKRIFEHALRVMDAQAEETWMAGDNLRWDVFGAQQLDIFAVWNDDKGTGLRPDSEIIPDLIVHSIFEMAGIISEL